MKPQMLFGAILTAIGIIVLAVGSGIRFVTKDAVPHERSSVKVLVKQEKVISIPPVVGGVALAGGVLLMLRAARK